MSPDAIWDTSDAAQTCKKKEKVHQSTEDLMSDIQSENAGSSQLF